MQEMHIALEELKFGGAMIYPLLVLGVIALVLILDKAFHTGDMLCCLPPC